MPPKRPRPAPANFAALHHYSLTPLPTTTTTTETPSTLTTEIQSLRRLIMDQELSISTLRQQLPSSSPPSAPSPTSTSTSTSTSTTTPTDPKHHLRILRARKSAHDTAFATIDHLPPAASPLNLLLAYRSVLLVTSRTADSLVTVQSAITAASATLDREGMELAQQRAITGALTARLQREEAEGEEREGEGGGRGVAEMVKRRKEVGRRTAGVLRELRGFVGGVLAGMLLAEEGGGGVVGDVVVEEVGGGEGEGEGEGEKKKGKERGERRLDEMWGQKEEPGEEPDKSMAREFMEVLEALMNASLENDPYIPIKKDTAIVRFLIRAKAAAFHPKDARRLRLVDFGSSVEDG